MCVEVTLAPAAVYNGEPDEERVGLEALEMSGL